MVRDLQSEGIAILFVSHKLNEIFAVAERITVLRDGVNVGTLPSAGLTNEKLVSLMTGRVLNETRFAHAGRPGRRLLEVRRPHQAAQLPGTSPSSCTPARSSASPA